MINIPKGSIAIINQTAPYGSSKGQESLELALAMSNFGQAVSLFFVEDGVWQLIQNQDPKKIDSKAYHKTFAALEFYEIENIFVCKQSLVKRNISVESLCIPVTIIEQTATPALLAKHVKSMVF
ncbi:sulfurtransferase complex subunit TusC [Paraglaciecola aquimarina]|uniref:Sulfurtransferase complex subunit TusC n=1 Tax=Paraglaciecola algarum TaxID=3050085 RepID=A0ABS9D4V8_9ALTE|nr:sulfurtransferase complex subunit TusC [Paraglaciecola sp. G1-23]MCF2947047.1 sulfurtransferase complex subunit TusC [Paraglaciecola sp. G1-23]